MAEWQWVQKIDRHLEESEFLTENKKGAKVGRAIGGVAGVAAVAAGVVYVGSTAAAANAASWAAGQQAAMAAMGPSAALTAHEAGFRVGKKAGEKARGMIIKSAAEGAWSLGRFGGAYVGASAEAGIRWVGDSLR
ncbi:hypothetical protein ACFYXF_51235 [Streptomyces sp. NPDC002680]|uniref:hypothetical protein n=1 Tax=Streptomyces sp. NPDC002680 TaxID=3364659 RepID=UPI0036AFD436